MEMSPEERVAVVFDLIRRYGESDYIGEAVSQLEHMVQAAMLAEQANYPAQVIIAAFLHDIGHLVGLQNVSGRMTGHSGNFGMLHHETIGAEYLKRLGFPEFISQLVANHVNAKRYLVWKDSDYHSNLSEASQQTLTHQGGPMQDSEALLFEIDSNFETILAMRRWDEAAKIPQLPMPPLSKYRQLCLDILSLVNSDGL